ncbi:MAG: hypothetical protein KC619_18905 [Myxococcales bacterium]|nr:hypothetical protein [Myxococcales bacterium]
MRATTSALVALLLLGTAATAAAQDLLERGREQLESADFSGAVETLSAGEQADRGLDRDGLATLYLLRAQAHLALEHAAEMEADVGRLVRLDPDHSLDAAVRPEIRQAFDRLRAADSAPLRVEVTPTVEAGGVRLEAAVHGDPSSLTRRLRVYGRVQGGAWVEGTDAVLVPLATSGTVEHYAVAIGPGGATLATEGSADHPRTFVSRGIPADAVDPDPSDGGDDVVPWVVAGVAIAAGIAIVIAIVIATTSTNDATQPGAPMIFPPM